MSDSTNDSLQPPEEVPDSEPAMNVTEDEQNAAAALVSLGNNRSPEMSDASQDKPFRNNSDSGSINRSQRSSSKSGKRNALSAQFDVPETTDLIIEKKRPRASIGDVSGTPATDSLRTTSGSSANSQATIGRTISLSRKTSLTLIPDTATSPGRRIIHLNSPSPPTSRSPSPPPKRARLDPEVQSPENAPKSTKPPFNIFHHLKCHIDILLHVTTHLSPKTLLDLYSVSKEFHYVMNSNWTAFILASASRYSPQAERVFPWACYRELCMADPGDRRKKIHGTTTLLQFKEQKNSPTTAQPSDNPTNPSPSQQAAPKDSTSLRPSAYATSVPSLRWLKMAVYRHLISSEILGYLAVAGHKLPIPETQLALKKLWFLLDLPLTALRISATHDRNYMSDRDLWALTMFFLKLDMWATDPVSGTGGEFVLRELLLSERSLTTLWNWLRGVDGNCRLDALRLWVKHEYVRPLRPTIASPALQLQWEVDQSQPIMGVPPKLVGRCSFEAYGLGDKRLLRPDELVMREGVRRGLELERQWVRMMIWGFLDARLENMPVVRKEDVVFTFIQRRKKEEQRARKEKWQKGEQVG